MIKLPFFCFDPLSPGSGYPEFRPALWPQHNATSQKHLAQAVPIFHLVHPFKEIPKPLDVVFKRGTPHQSLPIRCPEERFVVILRCVHTDNQMVLGPSQLYYFRMSRRPVPLIISVQSPMKRKGRIPLCRPFSPLPKKQRPGTFSCRPWSPDRYKISDPPAFV